MHAPFPSPDDTSQVGKDYAGEGFFPARPTPPGQEARSLPIFLGIRRPGGWRCRGSGHKRPLPRLLQLSFPALIRPFLSSL